MAQFKKLLPWMLKGMESFWADISPTYSLKSTWRFSCKSICLILQTGCKKPLSLQPTPMRLLPKLPTLATRELFWKAPKIMGRALSPNTGWAKIPLGRVWYRIFQAKKRVKTKLTLLVCQRRNSYKKLISPNTICLILITTINTNQLIVVLSRISI